MKEQYRDGVLSLEETKQGTLTTRVYIFSNDYGPPCASEINGYTGSEKRVIEYAIKPVAIVTVTDNELVIEEVGS